MTCLERTEVKLGASSSLAAVINFVVDGQPVAKGRPRFARVGKGVKAYTPAKTATYEQQVSWAAKASMCGASPLAGPVELHVLLYMQIPASYSKVKRARAISGDLRPTSKPDLDNVVKGIKDACNKIVWGDDSQVVRIVASKHYAARPFAAVDVKPVEGSL
ncbi:RusA family crossover junction endodeoxyribonuclease [Collimonas sp. OK412]|uniref:RusA family crossover junction endodeoxyribonuclease n=1 Tax=Collimonas sp. (strain OK412) TaxID=1801619 RepID=UPI0008E3F3AA|nr:RusA family crossover junction endodeoxyribonuclease [Collimonas sp. OK412]SFD03358.1 Holliday junction resolvase RusA (prophage-encoded endonuclease) [Collimonas sp. OK412]